MRPDELSKALAPESFRPFDIHLSNGESYRITHPDQVLVDRSAAMIGTRRVDGARRYEKTVICALIHIVSLVPAGETQVR